MASRSASRRSAGICVRWATADCRRGRGITRRTLMLWSRLKNARHCVAEIAARDAPGKPIEVWFADEARIGQKNQITRRWARRGTRPSAPSDQRTASTDIFGAICPERGTGDALVLPWCNSVTMALHLQESRLTGCTCRGSARPGRLAHVGEAQGASQHQLASAPAEGTRAEPAGERLAISARQLALQSRVRFSSRHRRSLLRCREQAHRPALDHHVHRASRLGPWVSISRSWY